jgi:hypothetical protein
MIENHTVTTETYPVQLQQPFKLTSTLTHDALANYLRAAPVDWDLLAHIHTGIMQVEPSMALRNSITYLTGILGELHVRELIRKFSTSYSEAIESPAFLGREKGNLRAKRKTEGSILFTDQYGLTLKEYDDLIEIEGVPTVIEVKTTLDRRDIKKSVKEATLRNKLRLLKGAYGPRQFGYIVVVPKNAPDVFAEFNSIGGVAITTSSRHEDFTSHATIIEQALRPAA